MTQYEISSQVEKMNRRADALYADNKLNAEQYDRVCMLIGMWEEGQTVLSELNQEDFE